MGPPSSVADWCPAWTLAVLPLTSGFLPCTIYASHPQPRRSPPPRFLLPSPHPALLLPPRTLPTLHLAHSSFHRHDQLTSRPPPPESHQGPLHPASPHIPGLLGFPSLPWRLSHVPSCLCLPPPVVGVPWRWDCGSDHSEPLPWGLRCVQSMVMDVLEGTGVCHLLRFIPSTPLSPARPMDRDLETNKPWSLLSRSSESKVGASTAFQGLADQTT